MIKDKTNLVSRVEEGNIDKLLRNQRCCHYLNADTTRLSLYRVATAARLAGEARPRLTPPPYQPPAGDSLMNLISSLGP